MRCRMEASHDSPGGFDCDTEFASGRKLTAEEIVAEARRVVGKPDEWYESHNAWVVLTGGEPALQIDKALIDALHDADFMVAIETNGSKNVVGLGIDWITVSPKVAEHAIRQPIAHEIKYVRGYGQAIPKPSCEAKHKLISPAFDGHTIDKDALEWCIHLVRDNPDWRLSVQLHKLWAVR